MMISEKQKIRQNQAKLGYERNHYQKFSRSQDISHFLEQVNVQGIVVQVLEFMAAKSQNCFISMNFFKRICFLCVFHRESESFPLRLFREINRSSMAGILVPVSELPEQAPVPK